MFERYTEKARRTIFFAREKAMQIELAEISSNCLLLSIAHEAPRELERWLDAAPASLQACRSPLR